MEGTHWENDATLDNSSFGKASKATAHLSTLPFLFQLSFLFLFQKEVPQIPSLAKRAGLK